ncbi:hypothetical protein EJC51_01395 [Streptomyces aquilus]|uniref:Uncharacterized protein n=1 Tax=Streptomyces aquilus TaxID=2548456 RepID=A0A3S9HSA2_9ACTN|nr:hypothetical protein [Streptomyces aquilus]AZP14919.1 hypothetical protein EJC51_01395 [Streptomyces aquilus]
MLDLDHAPAPWLLGDAALASAYNTAYERVYPGALTELGIPATALTGREAWERSPVLAAMIGRSATAVTVSERPRASRRPLTCPYRQFGGRPGLAGPPVGRDLPI